MPKPSHLIHISPSPMARLLVSNKLVVHLNSSLLRPAPWKLSQAITKDIVRDGFKEREADKDSVEERIKWASRNYGAQENQQTTERLANEKKVIENGIWGARKMGINMYPKGPWIFYWNLFKLICPYFQAKVFVSKVSSIPSITFIFCFLI